MKITIAENSGFCFGVEKAVCTAFELSKNNKKLFTLGKLIHNDYVVNKLESSNIFAVENLKDYYRQNEKFKKEFNKNATLVIRSHGVGKDILKQISDNNIPYIDCTCPFVKKIHEIVEDYYSKNYQIIVIGNKNHAEVIGINGWCDYSAIVVDNEENLSLQIEKNLCIVAQTTFNEEKFEKIAENIEKLAKIAGKIVVKNLTICYTTKERQKECVELSKKSDIMLVVGEKISSNTMKLFELASKYCKRTFLVSKVNDVKSLKLNNIFNLGIIAGASTPKELIMEVKQMAESQNKKEIKEDKMAELLASQENQKGMNLKEGRIYDCTVISASEDGLNVNFGGKVDGFIEKSNVELDGIEYNPANYAVGSVVKAILIPKTKKDDYTAFSKKLYDQRLKEKEEMEQVLNGSEFKAVVESASEKGLVSKFNGYHIFVPASQIRAGYVQDLQSYVGKTLRLRRIPEKKVEEGEETVLDTKIKGKRIVASQKVILEEERAKKIEEQKAKEKALFNELLSVVRVGDIVEGKVKRFTTFGAFVSVNGYDCLAHNSDLSHYKINDPSEVLEVNKSYEFQVLRIDADNGKVSLGYKQLQKKPYEIAFEKYPVGTVITGTVRSVYNYGVFVLIERNVDGLIPVSEIAYTYTKDPATLYKEGDEVTAKIIKFEDNKITLSVKALLPAPANTRVMDVETTDADLQEAMEKRNSKTAKKFATAPTSSAPRRTNRVKRDEPQEEVSWTSESSSATMADLFKRLNLNLSDDDSNE